MSVCVCLYVYVCVYVLSFSVCVCVCVYVCVHFLCEWEGGGGDVLLVMCYDLLYNFQKF